MRQHYFGLQLAELHHHLVNGFFGGFDRIVAGIEEANLGAQYPGGALGLLLTFHLHALYRHALLLPQSFGLTALAKREAQNSDTVALLRVERDCPARAPYKIGGMRTDY